MATVRLLRAGKGNAPLPDKQAMAWKIEGREDCWLSLDFSVGSHLAQCARTMCSTVTSCCVCFSPAPGRCSPGARGWHENKGCHEQIAIKLLVLLY